VKLWYHIATCSLPFTFSGPVDKVIIAQEHVSRLINALSPGAYRDLTKVDFASMDRVGVKPLGVYGSKQEIVRFLKHMGAVNKTT
jgi:hypothetical protein